MGNVESRLAALGYLLPQLGASGGRYLRSFRTGNLLFVSGHLPDSDGVPRFMGKLGQDLGTAEGYQAARMAIINALASVKGAIGDLDSVRHFVKLFGMVNSTPDYKDHAQVINGATDLLCDVFGDAIGPHARSAVGMASLPRGNSVEIEAILELESGS